MLLRAPPLLTDELMPSFHSVAVQLAVWPHDGDTSNHRPSSPPAAPHWRTPKLAPHSSRSVDSCASS